MVDAAGTEAVIQGVTAPMVAVPGPAQALMARSAGFGGPLPGMTAKIALREGNQDAFRRWIANRNDVITANGLDQLMDNNQMPTGWGVYSYWLASINRFCSRLGHRFGPIPETRGWGSRCRLGHELFPAPGMLPAGPWGVVRWGVRRVCGFAAGVASGGAGVGARRRSGGGCAFAWSVRFV